ncbi:hypothetical protein BCR39DRAFT_508050 [Naematelia encephala]|uniref:BTB domain-containing protein n=1 Tax=Naematelia encephala TaxID=71784 RepID=A0A1Y2AJC1_9TREE|nr:hypothetical protein BCR39DRAFT_508050 [Naematelia encephala]
MNSLSLHDTASIYNRMVAVALMGLTLSGSTQPIRTQQPSDHAPIVNFAMPKPSSLKKAPQEASDEHWSDPRADIVIVSSQGMRFRAHRYNLSKARIYRLVEHYECVALKRVVADSIRRTATQGPWEHFLIAANQNDIALARVSLTAMSQAADLKKFEVLPDFFLAIEELPPAWRTALLVARFQKEDHKKNKKNGEKNDDIEGSGNYSARDWNRVAELFSPKGAQSKVSELA